MRFPTTRPRPRPLLALLPLALLLAACGGGGGDDAPAPEADALRPYREQVLQWAPCDPTITGKDAGDKQTELNAQCATMRAPMDYAAPERGEVTITALRIPARDARQRRGALFFNPGGPGSDGLAIVANLHDILADSNPADTKGSLQLRLLQEYDLIGFSPRGTGASTTLACITNELERPVDRSAAGRHSPGNIDNQLYNARKAAEACRKNPLTPHINTEATAQDMDLLRGLLGDDKLNYIGYSYGTWLGAWYASRFPERVGRMVLDSNMDFSSPFDETALLQPMARHRLLDEVLSPYAARHASYFGLGTSADEVRALVASLPPRLQVALMNPLSGYTYKPKDADLFLFHLAAAKEIARLEQAMPSASADAIHNALEAHVFVADDPERNATMREIAHQLYGASLPPAPEQALPSIYLPPQSATHWAVRCNDSATITDIAYWVEVGDRYANRYPLFGTNMTGHLCAFWGGPSVSRPPLSAMQGLDVLMLQSQYDAATATEGALRAFEALPRAHGIYIPSEFEHAIYPYRDQCVDTAVVRYLLGESPAARTTTCSAHPLAQDAARLMVVPMRSSAHPTDYLNPEVTDARIKRLKDAIAAAASGIPAPGEALGMR